MNPLLGILGMNGKSGNSKMNLFAQAIAAASRGETPEQFMTNLAKNDPRFQGIDFSNLEKAARNICDKKGVNMNDEIEKVKSEVQSSM